MEVWREGEGWREFWGGMGEGTGGDV